ATKRRKGRPTNGSAARPSEPSLLRTMLSDRKCCIPFAVPTWLYFKRHVLEKEHVRVVFEVDANLSYPVFKELLIKHASPQAYGPSRARGSPRSQYGTKERYFWDLVRTLYDDLYPTLLNPATRTFSVQTSERYGGMGLFARRTIVLEAGAVVPGGIVGTVHAVSARAWQKLRDMHYSSLYSDSRIDGILTGALALANHDCGSKIGLRRRRSGRHRCNEDDQGDVIDLVARKAYVLESDSELVIHYGNCGLPRGVQCRCGTCA